MKPPRRPTKPYLYTFNPIKPKKTITQKITKPLKSDISVADINAKLIELNISPDEATLYVEVIDEYGDHTSYAYLSYDSGEIPNPHYDNQLKYYEEQRVKYKAAKEKFDQDMIKYEKALDKYNADDKEYKKWFYVKELEKLSK
jgi:hypothetical protein